ncbi:DUF1501 domain-containing protein [Prosthecobacter sp.]|uniref:DUF1501 domain-containing protein n=1 Tax=Prosthecobacter sp. TaxID=1965333 RepID=UPI001D906791|nr:DUF1501 domain-containing protein [Prosthecobacter sp.]MCB1278507.1 DUF1501 domain-containing protein [Prosthecobacter sp.]
MTGASIPKPSEIGKDKAEGLPVPARIALVMLSFSDQSRNSSRLHRRDFLRIGGLGLGGLSLSDLMAASQKRLIKDKSVIFLFMHGGPSQFETFDPKMDAPSEIRSVTGEIKTTLPGITFGGSFERLAKLAHKFSIVRSFVTGDAVHDIKTIVGKDTMKANLGSLYSRIAGPLRKGSAMPTNVALFPQSVDATTGPIIKQFGDFTASGEMGSTYQPFVPGAGGGAQADMTLSLPQARLDDRRMLLSSLDQWKRQMDASEAVGGMSEFQSLAFDVLRRGVSDAFDLSREDPRLIARYDTAPLLPKDRISTQWRNREHYADNAATLGKLLLMARRLCERGCGFVTVTTSFVWDMHSDINNVPVRTGMDYVGRPFDHAVSALIEDIEARGLSEKIMLVCCGEMGRSPKLNVKGGRDHWGGLAPLMVYGGGLKMGRVIGQSARNGGEPASEPVTIPDLISTIMHTLVDVGEARVTDGLPSGLLNVLTRGQPIRGLV